MQHVQRHSVAEVALLKFYSLLNPGYDQLLSALLESASVFVVAIYL
jgi:hypothetical protein